ncbi:hypothetical protein Tco_0374026 [Tanacetum coccineum]
MESLRISFQRVVDAGLFYGIDMGTSWQLSHLFYADDVIFMGKWSDTNIDILVKVLDCFHKASGLRINMHKSKLMGISDASSKKMKALSIGGRLTLVKSVLGSMRICNMSLFKVPVKVLQKMESFRCHFFNGVDPNGKRPIWVKWNNVLASKQKGGLGVSSLYALNKALLFKWAWRFYTQKESLWTKVIIGIHGVEGKLNSNS